MRKISVWMLAILLLIISTSACNSKPKASPRPPTVKNFRMIHQIGGTHYRTVVHDTFIYQTFGHSLLVLTPGDIVPLKTIALGKPGETGPAVDLILFHSNETKRLYIVLEDDEVIELSLDAPQSPAIVNRIAAAKLGDGGLRPRRLGIVDNQLYVSGIGGVVRMSDQRRIFSSDNDVSRVAMSDAGLIACVDRRIVSLKDGRYLGSATHVQLLNSSSNPSPSNIVLFARQGEQGVLVGLMSPQLQEIDAQRATVAVPGVMRSMRVVQDRLWIVTDQTITGYRMNADSLTDPVHIDVLGARDVARISDNHLAIVGTFGRAVYRHSKDVNGAGQTFAHVHREASRLSHALTDGRNILAGSNQGLWMYLINSRVELTSRQFDAVPPPPQTSAVVGNTTAKISDDGRRIAFTTTANTSAGGDASTVAPPPFTHVEPNQTIIRCVTAIDGDFWIGHDRGITVLSGTATVRADTTETPTKAVSAAPKSRNTNRLQPITHEVKGRLRIDGPVLYVYPLLVGGGASFVSEFGGFGVAKFVEEPVTTVFTLKSK